MSGEQILVVDDEADIRTVIHDILDDEGYQIEVAANAAEARKALAAKTPDLILLDIWMPDTDGITLLHEWIDSGNFNTPVIMLSGHGTVDTAIEATRLGAADFLEKPLSLAKLLDTIERALTQHQRASEKSGKDEKQTLVPERLEPLGRSGVIEHFREQLQRAAQHDVPVLLVGEPGSGRETAARYLHALSRRAEFPFVAVVAASLRENAVSTLLGDDLKPGLIQQARDGVLFIDELRDLDADSQRLLAGIIESGEYTPPGAEAPEALECQVMASARPGDKASVDGGLLRPDLVGAISALTIKVPPLRQYCEDVPDLLRYYVDLLVDQEELPFRRISFAAQNRLRNYPWPDNLRELRHVVRQLLVLGRDGEATLAEVDEVLATTPEDEDDGHPLVKQDWLGLPLREAREHFERAYLEQQLKLSGGRVGKLAERVGLERTNLYRKLRSLGIDLHPGDG